MVLDWADETVESMARVIQEYPPNESLTAAVVRAMKEDMERSTCSRRHRRARFVDLIDDSGAARGVQMYEDRHSSHKDTRERVTERPER